MSEKLHKRDRLLPQGHLRKSRQSGTFPASKVNYSSVGLSANVTGRIDKTGLTRQVYSYQYSWPFTPAQPAIMVSREKNERLQGPCSSGRVSVSQKSPVNRVQKHNPFRIIDQGICTFVPITLVFNILGPSVPGGYRCAQSRKIFNRKPINPTAGSPVRTPTNERAQGPCFGPCQCLEGEISSKFGPKITLLES
jgi:hypothetical protein